MTEKNTETRSIDVEWYDFYIYAAMALQLGIQRRRSLGQGVCTRGGLSQAAKRNALQKRCEIDPLSGTSCTSVRRYHMSLPRVELDNLNQPDDRRFKPARLPYRHRLLGVETVPGSPMLHQLRARVEKRRRYVAHVEFRSRGGSRD